MARISTRLAALGLSGVVALTAFVPAAKADHIYRGDGYRVVEDHDGWRPRRIHRVRRHRDNDVGAAIALGAGALILGAIIADSANNAPPPRRVYRDYEEPRVVRYRDYGGSFEPWSAEWYEWCDARYRSFNPRTGTYRGYDGRDHFCEAN